MDLHHSQAKSSSNFVTWFHSQAKSLLNFVALHHSQAKFDNSWICAVEFVFHSAASLSREVWSDSSNSSSSSSSDKEMMLYYNMNISIIGSGPFIPFEYYII